MPLYEYTCEECRKRSEILVKGSEAPVCPECGSSRLHKEFSTFSTNGEVHGSGSGKAPHPSGCGCCMGPQGPCSLN